MDEYNRKEAKAKAMKLIPCEKEFGRMTDLRPDNYDKFVEWNRKCLDEMYEDDMEHLEWLCEWIAKGKVRNMDMEFCSEFRSQGLYFNENRQLVIYNGR